MVFLLSRPGILDSRRDRQWRQGSKRVHGSRRNGHNCKIVQTSFVNITADAQHSRKGRWLSNGLAGVSRYNLSSSPGSNIADCHPDAVSPELRRLGVGRVMDDVSQKMQRKALKKNEDPLKILVNCTHDTTIAGVLQTFGVYDQK